MCVKVVGTDSGGESSVETCSDLVMTTGRAGLPVAGRLRRRAPVVLSARTSRGRRSWPPTTAPTVQLEVTDGLGGTATDRVQVSVTNVAPR